MVLGLLGFGCLGFRVRGVRGLGFYDMFAYFSPHLCTQVRGHVPPPPALSAHHLPLRKSPPPGAHWIQILISGSGFLLSTHGLLLGLLCRRPRVSARLHGGLLCSRVHSVFSLGMHAGAASQDKHAAVLFLLAFSWDH